MELDASVVPVAKVLTRREEIDAGIPWVEKYRPQRYVTVHVYQPMISFVWLICIFLQSVL
jgi:hypothetical protein